MAMLQINTQMMTLLLSLLSFAGSGCDKRNSTSQKREKPSIVLLAQGSLPSPKSFARKVNAYHQIKKYVEKKRKEFLVNYRAAKRKGRKKVLRAASAFLAQQLIDKLIPAWYGVPWIIVGGKEEGESTKSGIYQELIMCHQ